MNRSPLVAITEETHNLVLDMRYATSNNFTGAAIYQQNRCFLHPDAEACLNKAIALAASIGYRFKVFDAFRPKEAQIAMWNHTPDPNYLSHPDNGSVPHCRGVAVDLTLIDKNGSELEMGTEFDAFTKLSHHARTDISEVAQRNRITLLGIMTAAGWDNYRNEWWHYQLFDSKKYAILTQGSDTIAV